MMMCTKCVEDVVEAIVRVPWPVHTPRRAWTLHTNRRDRCATRRVVDCPAWVLRDVEANVAKRGWLPLLRASPVN